MSVLRISQRWTIAAVLLAILAYGVAEEDSGVLVIGIVGALTSWLLTRGSPPRAMPRSLINTLLFGVVAWGTWGLFNAGLGVSLFSQFVMALLIVKLLDRRGPRDTAQLLTLSVFLVIGAILTSNSFTLGMLMLAFLPVIIGAVLWYQLSRVERGASEAASAIVRPVRKRGAAVVVAAMPIAAVVFILMPRELGSKALGAWGTAAVGSTVGFNDEVRLGLGGLISQSQEPVLDMQLFDREGEPLGAVGQRFYLRGAVLHDYDPRSGTWTRSDSSRYVYTQGPAPQLRPGFVTVGGAQPGSWNLRQEITIRSVEGNRGHLFTIWQTNQVRVPPTFQLEYSTGDAALRVRGDTGRISYTVHSNDQVPIPETFERPTPEERLEPVIDNPEVREIAERILRDAGIEADPLERPVDEDARAVAALENFLTGGGFRYTLETLSAPPGRDPIEWFLSDTREGHCEYYASSLALMCRTVGINARVITGFVATDYNDTTESYIVRASNAHAWVEAETLPDDWRTIDPTPAADLARIHEPPVGLIADARRLLNTLEFAWIRTVIGYDGEARKDLLGNRESASMFPLWERLSGAAYRAQRAPPRVLLRAARNALLAFCAAVLFGVLVIREWARIRRAAARAVRWLSLLLGRGPVLSGAQRTHAELLRLLRRAGTPKPGWVPLRTHTDHLTETGELDAGVASAMSRIVERLYAEYFANADTPTADASERDLLEIRSWARSRARRDRHCRTKPIGPPDARERTTDAREPETG